MTNEIEFPVTYRPALPYWIMFGALLFGLPILIIFKGKVEFRDIPFALGFVILCFSPPFLWLFQYLRLSEDGFIYSPFPFWPSKKIDWGDVDSVFVIPDYKNSKDIQIGLKNRAKKFKLPISLYSRKNITEIIQMLKTKSPRAKLDEFIEDLYRPKYMQKDNKYKRPRR